ncbi:MAG: cadherin-like domain-containing protein [Candidatus Competibacteraceae bacterium]|nr:cadherin-like domain-containing protein [Candidatus Competibacteraceae bacterium]
MDSILGNNLKEQNDPSALIAVLGPSLRIENSVLDFKENKTLFPFEGGASNGLGGKTVEILDSVIAVGVAGATSTAMRFENSDVSITNSKLIGALTGFCGALVEARQNTRLALTNVTMFADGRPCPVEPDLPALLGVFSGSQLNIVNTLLFRRAFGNPIDPATHAPAVTVSGATITRSANNFADDPEAPAILGGTATGDPGLLLNGYACNFTQFPPGDPDCDPVLGSPLIDAGDSLLAVDPRTGNPLAIDLRRNPRINGAAVDIGALERQQAPGSITIVKQATPKDGTNLNFILGGPDIVQQNFTLDDAAPDDNDSIGASKTIASLTPGAYLLSEQSVAGWHLESIVCTSDRPGSALVITLPSVSITLREAERVTCTFTNQKQGSLTVVKKALGGNDTFNFSSNTLIPDSFPLTTTNGAAQITYNNLAPGRYDISENTLPAGWSAASATCDNGDDPSAIDVVPGANVTCTFENRKQNNIIVVKRAIGGDNAFNFTASTNLAATGAFSLTTVNGEAVQAFGGLAAGSYSIAETASAGWTATVADPVCSNGNNASNINLASGQIVVCVFLSVIQDTLVVEKKTLGGDATFNFTSSSNAIGNFSLTTMNGEAIRAFNNLPSGQYNVTEATPPTGWDLTGNTCSSGVTLSPGGLVTCTFTNTQRGAINIVKRTTSGDGTFSFTSATLGNFNLTTRGTTATQHFPNLLPGAYSVNENAQAGWEQGAATCSDGSNPTAIQLDPGETVTCTFTSAQDGQLVVVKNTVGGDATFAFTSTVPGHSSFNLATVSGTATATFANVKPGAYALQEQPLAGWDLVSAQCSNGNNPDAITLVAGQTITCTFINARKGTANQPPVANADSYTTPEGVLLDLPAPGVLANDRDPDGNPLSAILVAPSTQGTVQLTPSGGFTYQPTALTAPCTSDRTDAFTYFANDGLVNSTTPATVTLTIHCVNQAPVGRPDAYSTPQDTDLVVPAPGVLTNDSDPDGNLLQMALVTGPAHGALTPALDGSFRYRPAPGFSGADAFTYQASDGALTSTLVTVTLTVVPTVTPPVNPPVTLATARLINLSSRGWAGSGDALLIDGFILGGGDTPRPVIVRALGPALADIGLADPLANPRLRVTTVTGDPIAENDDWQQAPNAAELERLGYAPAYPQEAALLLTLNPHVPYTVLVDGADAATGLALVEILDPERTVAVNPRLINLSARGWVGTGDDLLIGGLILGGGDAPRRILARVLGPTLVNAPLGDPLLENPQLTFTTLDGQVIAENDDWAQQPDAAAIAATGLAPPDPREPALLLTLEPHVPHTLLVRGVNGATGLALLEILEVP